MNELYRARLLIPVKGDTVRVANHLELVIYKATPVSRKDRQSPPAKHRL